MEEKIPCGEEINEKEKKKGLSALLSDDRSLSIILIIGVLGITLIFISTSFGNKGDNTPAEQEESTAASDVLSDYKEELSGELGNMLASMEGVGRTKVMVTLSGTVKNVYATNTDINDRETSRRTEADENADKQNTEKKNCILIKQKDGSEKALTVGQLLPEVKGVLVICDGGDSGETRKKIKEAVSAALNIPQSHICVNKLEG